MILVSDVADLGFFFVWAKKKHNLEPIIQVRYILPNAN